MVVMPDFLTLGLNQRLINETLAERNRPALVADPAFITNRVENALNGLLQNRLSAESILVAQGGDNARQANTALPNVADALDLIDVALAELDTLATQAADSDTSDTERAFIDIAFQAALDRINGIAERTEEDGVNVLAGTNDFAAANIGTDLEAADGIDAILFDAVASGNVANGDAFTLGFDASAAEFVLTNTTTGRVERVDGPAAAPGTGETENIFFVDFGIVVTLNENFNTGADIDASGGNAGFDISGSLTARGFDVQVGTGTDVGDTVSVALQPVFTGQLAAALRTADVQSSASATTALAAVASAQSALAERRGDVAGIQQQLGEVSFGSARSEGILRDSATSILRQVDQRRELFKILSDIGLDFVTPGLTAPFRNRDATSDAFQIVARNAVAQSSGGSAALDISV